jgi:hypothetical protein
MLFFTAFPPEAASCLHPLASAGAGKNSAHYRWCDDAICGCEAGVLLDIELGEPRAMCMLLTCLLVYFV